MTKAAKARKSRSTSGKKWIKGAIKRPGALHKALGVPQGKRIPKSKIAAAAKKPGRLGKMARLARTLGKMKKR